MKQYKISSWGFDISEVEITRKSGSSIWYIYNGHERRESDTYYFDTPELAKEAIVTRELRDLRNAEIQLQDAKNDYQKALDIVV